METQSDVSMECPQCWQPFNFPKEGLGQVVPCPHCKADVRLRGAAEKKTESPERVGQSKVKYLQGGMEGQLDTLSFLTALCGVIGGGIVVVVGLVDGIKINLLICGAGIIAAGIAGQMAFKTYAEIIRLLKMKNGIPFGGRLISVSEEVFCSCPLCKSTVLADAKQCPACQAVFKD